MCRLAFRNRKTSKNVEIGDGQVNLNWFNNEVEYYNYSTLAFVYYKPKLIKVIS